MRHFHIIFLSNGGAYLYMLLIGVFLNVTSLAQTSPPLRFTRSGSPDSSLTLHDYVRQTVTYPQAALRAGIEGEVYLEYFVQANGLITEVRTLQGIGHGCDEAAETALCRVPTGLAVPHLNAYEIKTKSILVVRFTLQNSTIATYEY